MWLQLRSHGISCTNTSRNPLCIQLYVYWYSIMALKSADSITSRIFHVNNIPYCNHVCRWGILVFWLLTCLHEVYWYIWPYFQNLRYIGMSTIVYEVNWMFPYILCSQGGLDGVNAFHCRSCYMYSGTGTYSTAVQVPVPQLYGFLTVYFWLFIFDCLFLTIYFWLFLTATAHSNDRPPA